MPKAFLLSVTLSGILASLGFAAPADPAPEVVLLWPGSPPGAQGTADADIPKYTVYQAASPVHTGVLVCPGGGYQGLSMDHEGLQIAKWLNGYGVTAFVLQYRLGPKYHHPIEMNDAKRAVRMIRAHSREYGLDPNRIGIWGFSAGGHLAATVSTHQDNGNLTAADPIDRFPAHLNFAILAYPVISFGAFAHQGSVLNLLGPNPDAALLDELSNEKHVTQQTPPTFLFATSDDPVVPVENSVLYYLALRKANVPAEMHLYEHGAHGVGLALYDPILSTWPGRLADWLRSHGWLAKPQK
jgi:acetyl esterase/lipase